MEYDGYHLEIDISSIFAHLDRCVGRDACRPLHEGCEITTKSEQHPAACLEKNEAPGLLLPGLRPCPIAPVAARSAPEQREQDDDWKGDTQKPKQRAAAEAHDALLACQIFRATRQMRNGFRR